MGDPRTQIVADGYGPIGDTFAGWRERIVGDPRQEWEEELTSRLADGSRVLELGCGAGTPETRRLASRFRLTGVDVSPRQVARARAAIPEAEFVCADFTAMELPPESFDAVASFYVFNHVPRDLLAPLLLRIRGWLSRNAGGVAGRADDVRREDRVPAAPGGGWLLAAFGTSDTEAWTGDWLGAPTFFSSFSADVNSRLVREAGFEIVRDEVVEFDEPEGPAQFQWVLASR
jgi:SAM-dependent methyltransferase